MNLKRIFKLIIIFLVTSLVSLVFSFSIVALVFSLFNIPMNLISKITLISASFGVFIASFFVSQLTENLDIILSLICGLILTLIVIVVTALTTVDFLNLNFYIKTGSIILASLLGGFLAKFLKL